MAKKNSDFPKILAPKLGLCKLCSSRQALYGISKKGQYLVICGACNAGTEYYDTPEQAAAAWNGNE